MMFFFFFLHESSSFHKHQICHAEGKVTDNAFKYLQCCANNFPENKAQSSLILSLFKILYFIEVWQLCPQLSKEVWMHVLNKISNSDKSSLSVFHSLESIQHLLRSCSFLPRRKIRGSESEVFSTTKWWLDTDMCSITSCSRLWSSVSSSSPALFLTPGSSLHSVDDCVREMDRRGEEGLPSHLGGSGRGKLLTLVIEPVLDNEWGCRTGGKGGRGLRAGGGEGAGDGVDSSHTETTSERAWRRISKFWAASLYCW